MSAIEPLTMQTWTPFQPNPRDWPDKFSVKGFRVNDGALEEFEIELREKAFDTEIDMDIHTAHAIGAVPRMIDILRKFTSATPQTATEAEALKIEAAALLKSIGQ